MKLPVIKAIGASFAYLAAHFLDLIRTLWLPILLLNAALIFVLPRYLGPVVEIMGLGDRPDPAAVLALMGPAFKWLGVLLLANAVLYPMAYAGVLKHVVRGESPRAPFYFQFGGDELKVLAAFVLFAIMAGLIYIFGVLGVLALSAALAALSKGVGGALGAVFVVAFVILFLWFCLRMSLIFPATIATKRIGLPASWAATKGNVARLFFYFLLFGLITLAVASVFLALTAPDYFADMARMAAAAGDPARARELEVEMVRKQLAAWSPSSPGFALRAAGTYVYTLALIVLWTVPPAVAWRYIAGESGAR